MYEVIIGNDFHIRGGYMENIRSKYKTKQREILLEYLKALSGEHITAGDVCEYCKAQGSSIGQSTVYRQLESLVDEGLINLMILLSARNLRASAQKLLPTMPSAIRSH